MVDEIGYIKYWRLGYNAHWVDSDELADRAVKELKLEDQKGLITETDRTDPNDRFFTHPYWRFALVGELMHVPAGITAEVVQNNISMKKKYKYIPIFGDKHGEMIGMREILNNEE